MATETSFPGPGVDRRSTASDPAPDVDPSEPLVKEKESPEKPAESSQSPPTTPKKIGFSISSILDDGAKMSPHRQQIGGGRLSGSMPVSGPSNTYNKSQTEQLTFFYREKLLCSQETQRSNEGAGSADALISSWTVPPTSPFVYRE